jgi:hypothetical protein
VTGREHFWMNFMGLGNGFIADLADLKRRGKLEGFSKVIEIGAQQLSNALLRDDDGLNSLYELFGKRRVPLGGPINEGFVNGVEHQSESNPSSRVFWQSLGFAYASLEFDGHRDSIAIDLNRDSVPRNMRGGFQLLVNAGTTEHVANQDNAFKVMHDLVGKDGIMMHELPAGGMMNHGIVNYNMKFFWHLCRENEYEAVRLKISSCGVNPVPRNIIDSNRIYGGEGDFIKVEEVPDFAISAALRKVTDTPYVTLLDVPPEIMPAMKRPLPSWERLKRMVGLP